MNYENVIEAHNIRKKFRKFELNIPEFTVPKGFSTALIGWILIEAYVRTRTKSGSLSEK